MNAPKLIEISYCLEKMFFFCTLYCNRVKQCALMRVMSRVDGIPGLPIIGSEEKIIKKTCCVTGKDGRTVRSEFAYYVPRTLNRTVPVHRTSVQFLKRTVPTYRTRTVKQAYRTSVPYFLAKIEAYRTVPTYLPYRTAILGCRLYLCEF